MGARVLTDRQVKKAKPTERDYKITDSAGLYLYVTRKGAKSWRLAPFLEYFKVGS